ncbi:MAG: thioredoxin fold domain-containing protein [Campylobacterales bacterium]|nr:thioredoxin fold domain-containing protein [Campylobacterales bacterium]
MIKVFILLVFIFSIISAEDIKVDTLFSEAEKSHKHVLIFLHKPNCGYCERMIDFTLQNERIAFKIKKDFVFVDINIADTGKVSFKNFEGSRRDFAKYLGYDFYPSTIFMNNKKEIVYSQPGYQDEDKYFKILSYIDSHSYQEMGIEEFK